MEHIMNLMLADQLVICWLPGCDMHFHSTVYCECDFKAYVNSWPTQRFCCEDATPGAQTIKSFSMFSTTFPLLRSACSAYVVWMSQTHHRNTGENHEERLNNACGADDPRHPNEEQDTEDVLYAREEHTHNRAHFRGLKWRGTCRGSTPSYSTVDYFKSRQAKNKI